MMRRFLTPFAALGLAAALLVPGGAQAACTVPSVGNPAFSNATKLDTMTSDAVKLEGGCIEGPVFNNQVYYAPAYKDDTTKERCKWEPTTDVGPCINAALNAANAAGGGKVMLPAGSFGQSTAITIPSKVSLVGAGGSQSCGTKLTALSGFSGTMVSSTDTEGTGFQGICLDGNDIASENFKWLSVRQSEMRDFRFVNATSKGLHLDVSLADTAGVAQNVIKHGVISVTGSADAFYIGPGTGNNDVHSNHFEDITTFAVNGSPFVGGSADTNTFVRMRFDVTGAGTGQPIFKAGTSGADLRGWFRYNNFFGAAIGSSGGTGQLIVETGTRPSAGNTIIGLKRGDGSPHPSMQSGTQLFCMNTTGDMCGGTSPWEKFKFGPLVTEKASDYTLVSNDCGTHYHNSGAGERIFTLPDATGTGCTFQFTKSSGTRITVTATGSSTVTGSAGVTTAANGSVYSTRGGSTITLQDRAADEWVIKTTDGPWQNTATDAYMSAALMTDASGQYEFSDALAKVSTAVLSKTTDTAFESVAGLSVSLAAGKTYLCSGTLSGTSGASGGVKARISASGGLTATTVRWRGRLWNGTTAVENTEISAIGSSFAASTAVYTNLDFEGAITVGVAGSLLIQAAQNASNATATTVIPGSHLSCRRVN
jgi:hypothetical protein